MRKAKNKWPKMGVALAPGACGELVEGLIGDQAFLVSCPIDLYSKAKVSLYPRGSCPDSNQKSDNWPKARQAVTAALSAWQENNWEFCLDIESTIPRSKGMASSTADIGAAVAATALALGRIPDPLKITQLAVSIEPTDSTLFPELTIFDHVTGSLYSRIGKSPPLQVMVFDWGGEIESANWYQVDSPMQQILERQSLGAVGALELIRQGVRQGNANMLAEGATLSALLHQAILHKPNLGELASFARQKGALGITVAHSGTVAGLLYPPIAKSSAENIADSLSHKFPQLQYLGTYSLIGGGLRW
jgi:L-threonine kinase